MLKKILIGSTFILFAVCSTAFAADIYSHIVLKLPYEPRNDAPWVKIIQSQEEWEFFYEQLMIDNTNPSNPEIEAAPVIDFLNFQMIAGGLGMRNYLGSSKLLVERIRESDDEVIVSALEVRQSGGCLGFTALSYPSVAILIRKTDKPVTVTLSTVLDECEDI